MEQTWLEPTIQQWVTNIEILSKVAVKHPQSVYTALSYSLQTEWQYLSKVMPLASKALSLVEQFIQNSCLLS